MYTLMWASPGTIIDKRCPVGCSKEYEKKLIKEHHLDRSLFVQYGFWLKKAVSLDFGYSAVRQSEKVIDKLIPAASLTMLLVFGATFLTILLSFFLGWIPSHPLPRWGLRIFQYPFIFFSFVPLYILAYGAVTTSGETINWMEKTKQISEDKAEELRDRGFLLGQDTNLEWLVGKDGLTLDKDEGETLGGKLLSTLFPLFIAMFLLALGNNNLVEQSSSLRNESDNLKEQGFIRTVRARGASYFRHLSHHLLLPCIQFFTTRMVFLLGTAVIIETVMNLQGIGYLLWNATTDRDVPVVLAIALFATVTACLLQMINEISLKLIDPRLRGQSSVEE